MASDPNVPINPPGGPYFTQRLWSEEVAIARAEAGDLGSNRDPSYEFGNGRKFVEPVSRVWGEGRAAPTLIAAPVITGNNYDGSTLTSTTGTWDAYPVPEYAYQWTADGTNVGSNQNTYVTQVGDIGKLILCTVTATNEEGTASRGSNAITVTASASPSNTVAPVVSGSQPAGSTLTSTTGTWTANPAVSSYSYQWKADAGNVGTNQATYVTQVGDVGKSITCTVTATNVKGSGSQASNGVTVTAALESPANTVAPVISGDTSAGSTLTSTTGTWTGNPTPTYGYQWKSDGANVGSNQNTYVTQEEDVDADITCTVTATNSQGFASQVSNAITVTVSNPDAVIEALFANSEVGAWYDPSDLSTMFQDSAGATPVTAADQNVLRINDKSGNGNDIIFNAGIPLAQNPLGIYYLQGNGAYGETASTVDLSAFDKISIVCGSKSGNVDGSALFSFGNITANAGSLEIGFQSVSKPLLYWRGSTGFVGKYYGSDIQNEIIYSTQVNIAGTDAATESPVFRLNANDVSTTIVNSDCGTGSLGNFVFRLLSGYQPTSTGRFYGLVAVTWLLDAATNLSVETWMAQKTGIDITQNPLYYEIVPTSFTDSLAPIDKTTYYETSPFAQVVFDTTATEIEVVAECNIASLFLDMAEIGVYVDGVFSSGIQQGGDGVNANRFTLSAGSKRVSIVNGAQSQLSPIKGTFVDSVHANAAMAQVFPTVTNRVYIYGDSIAIGANCVYAQENAWTMQLRRYRGTDSTMVDAQGYRALSTDASDGTARTAFVAKVVSANPATLWMAIGTNDYGIPTTNAADFGSDYAALLDALHAALPSLVIYCQTPIVRTSEVANSFGNTLGDYRSQISTAVSTRTGYCTLVNGATLVSTSDLQDGVHPTDAGHGIYYAAVKTVLGI